MADQFPLSQNISFATVTSQIIPSVKVKKVKQPENKTKYDKFH